MRPEPFNLFDGTHTREWVQDFLLDPKYAYSGADEIDLWAMQTNRDHRKREDEGLFDVAKLWAFNLQRRYDPDHPYLSAMDNLALDVLLPWADVQSSTVCGGDKTAPVHCVGVTRLPTKDPNAIAMAIGHIILLDTTSTSDDIFEENGVWLPSQELLAHELTHVYRAQHWSPTDNFGVDDRWYYVNYLFESGSEEACADQVGQGDFDDTHLVSC